MGHFYIGRIYKVRDLVIRTLTVAVLAYLHTGNHFCSENQLATKMTTLLGNQLILESQLQHARASKTNIVSPGLSFPIKMLKGIHFKSFFVRSIDGSNFISFDTCSLRFH